MDYGKEGFLEAQKRMINILETTQNGINELSTSELVRQCASAAELIEKSRHYTLDVTIKPEYKTLQRNLEIISQAYYEEAKRRDRLL